MSKGTNISFNMPTPLWEKLLAKEGSPGEHIIAAVECYLDMASCVALPPAEDNAAIEADVIAAPAKGGKKS